MFARLIGICTVLLIAAGSAPAQEGAAATANKPAVSKSEVSGWHRPDAVSGRTGAANPSSPAGSTPDTNIVPGAATASAEGSITRVTEGTGTLPNRDGQVWRQYDISPYTQSLSSTEKPEQAIIDWILRETGTEVWFSSPVGLLNADRTTLRVYHTPEMQKVVAGMVDRFVAGRAEIQAMGVRLMTVHSPNWRVKAGPVLRPVTVQTPGIEAWLLSKEDAAVLLADLRKRTDYREHAATELVFPNGQTATVSVRRPRSFARSVSLRPDAWPGYQLDTAQLDEGFTIELSSLLSVDRQTVDAVVKCRVDQVEALVPVTTDVPVAPGQRRRVQIQVPQTAAWRLHERFRWPRDRVLLVSAGVVAMPGPGRATTIGLANPFETGPPRANLLLMIDHRGKADPTRTATPATSATAKLPTTSHGSHGRY